MLDPITRLHEALEDIIEEDDVLKDLVRPGGRCRFVRKSTDTNRRNRDPRNHVIQESNSPELRLTLDSMSFIGIRDNMTGELELYFSWQISSVNQMLDMGTYPVIVALCQGLRRHTRALEQLQLYEPWYSNVDEEEKVPRPFVEHVEIMEGVADQPQIGMNYRNPVVEGWQTILTVYARITV